LNVVCGVLKTFKAKRCARFLIVEKSENKKFENLII
jgi:hypothetical protein